MVWPTKDPKYPEGDPIFTLGIILCFILVLVFMCFSCQGAEWTNTEIVNAIYKAEGAEKATFLYGIRSVSYDSPAEARRICFNTVKNQRKRHFKHTCGKEYLVCLRDRYAPLEASNDPQGLNSNWLANVRYFLRKGESR